MKNIFLLFIIFILFQGCQKDKDIQEHSIAIVKIFQKGNTEAIKKEFYSDEYVNELPNIEEAIKQYPALIGELQIDKKENIIIETRMGYIPSTHFKDSVSITSAYVPIAVTMPSPVPSHFMELHYVNKEGNYKLVAFNLRNTAVPDLANELTIQDQIYIDKNRITEYSFMYEGGYKHPMIFKRKRGALSELKDEKHSLDILLRLINNSKIVKAQKETDTKRFYGDPELGIIKFEMDDNYQWTLFTLISEEPTKKENFPGTLELRYYEYLNIAVTYWIEVEDNELLKQVMLSLSHSGENIRTKPKESIKLDIEHHENTSQKGS